jgi:hypothetical protein
MFAFRLLSPTQLDELSRGTVADVLDGFDKTSDFALEYSAQPL